MEAKENKTSGKDILRQFEKVVSARQVLENYWKDAYTYTLPHKGMGFINKSNDPLANANNAKSIQSKIFDSTAPDAVRLLASSMVSGLVPKNSQWFDLTIPNIPNEKIEQDALIFLQQSSTHLFRLIHASNFDGTVLDHFEHIGIAGWGALYIEKEEGGAFKFETWAPDNLYIADVLGKGQIDTVYRLVSFTLSQAVHKFGLKNLPEEMQNAHKNNFDPDKLYQFIHVITPRMIKGKQASGNTANTMPWKSCYVEQNSKRLVKESGYNEFPCVVPRWSLIPNTQYAVGQVNTVLPDIKTLNKIVEYNLQNNEMNIGGVFIAQQDGIINQKTFKLRSRQVNFVGDVNQFKSITSPGNYNVAVAEIQRIQNQIRQGMMADDLSPIKQQSYASATEVSQRQAIIRQILAPIFNRLTAELLEPLIRRCFNLAYRDGTLGKAPDSLMQYSFVPSYSSPLARAAKMEEIASMDQYEQALAGTAQIYPAALDLYDFDAALNRRAELLGVPADLIKSKQSIADSRKQQAQAAQDAAMQQQQMPPANISPDQVPQ